MKRRIGVIILGLIGMLSIAGCQGKQNTEIPYDAESLEEISDVMIGNFAQIDEESLNAFLNQSELQINLSLMQSQIPADKGTFKAMAESFVTAVKECGAYIEHGEYTITANDKEITVSTEAQFEKRSGEIEFKFDKASYLKSLTVNPVYTKGEILTKAGQNTLLGMGTVFLVLIFIAFIISLLKYIPDIIERMKGKKRQNMQEETIQIPEEEPADEEDDMEIAAVIAAAIAADTGMPADEFVVRSIKRRKTNNWRAL